MVNGWKVTLLLCASAVAYDRPSRALSIYSQKNYNVPMFVPRIHKRNRARQSRVLFLDEDESRQPVGRGEIDLTQPYGSKIKFDDATDYDFTSPEDSSKSTLEEKELASTNERYYDAPRFRNNYHHFTPQFYQGRFSRPYAPSFGFDPYYLHGTSYPPALRTSFYNPSQNGWKARSPRVVFPYQEPGSSLQQTNSHAGPGAFNDNVVFREQNFGLNDVGTDDLALQDIGTGNADAFAERVGVKGLVMMMLDSKVPLVRPRDSSPHPPIHTDMLVPSTVRSKRRSKGCHSNANVPHRAQNKRMDAPSVQYDSTKYIPLYKTYETKPMFIQTESTKILPPDLLRHNFYEYTNLTREYGGRNAVLPKFRPISDEQMLKISEILKELPIRSTNAPIVQRNTKTHRVRKGRILNDNNVQESNVEITTVKATTPNDRNDESCSQGGTCEFFIYCWMVGGLLEGTCGGLLKGCCHRTAKSGLLGVQDSNSIDSTANDISFGPVINDQSKSYVPGARFLGDTHTIKLRPLIESSC